MCELDDVQLERGIVTEIRKLQQSYIKIPKKSERKFLYKLNNILQHYMHTLVHIKILVHNHHKRVIAVGSYLCN